MSEIVLLYCAFSVSLAINVLAALVYIDTRQRLRASLNAVDANCALRRAKQNKRQLVRIDDDLFGGKGVS